MIPVEKFIFVKAFSRMHIKKTIRYWDKAGTEGGGCRTAGVLMHDMKDGSVIIENVVKGQWGATNREMMIKQTAQTDRERSKEVEPYQVDPSIWIEQEGGSGGKESTENTIMNLSGFLLRRRIGK